MKKYRLSDDAFTDLEEIWSYIARDNPDAADRVLEGMMEDFKLLARSPAIGRKRDDLALGLRCFPYSSYVILYKSIRQGILIVRVISGYRDIQALFKV